MSELKEARPRRHRSDGTGAVILYPERTCERSMVGNGLYRIIVEMLDGIKGGNQGVMVVRDGALRGGDSCFYANGPCTTAKGRWKGEVTNRNMPGASVSGRYGKARSLPLALPELIPMRSPKPMASRLRENKAFGSNPGCGCCSPTRFFGSG